MARNNNILLETGTNEMELLTVYLGNQVFGINVAKVQAIVQFEKSLVTPLPQAPVGMMGMLSYREETIPLIDLSTALDLPNGESNKRPVVVITEFNDAVNGFRVDGVQRIHRVNWNNFEPASPMFSNSGSNITGSVSIDEVDILVLDMEQILAHFFPDLSFEKITPENHAEEALGSRSALRVFFAEDSGSIRKRVTRALHKAGLIRIEEFETGQDAFIELYHRSSAGNGANDTDLPHLMLTDIEMPKMDGLTLCRKIKTDPALENIKVIVFSSLVNDQMIAKCKGVAADGWVTKPRLNNLVTLIDKVCHTHVAVNS